MNRKIVLGVIAAFVILLAAVGVFVAQEPPSPPMPPELPRAAATPRSFFFADGGSWLGVRVRDITEEKARELKLSGENGVMVEEVDEDSPAAKAGLARNDVILEFAGERVRSVAQFQRLVRETPAGRAVALQVSRAGQARSLNVRLEPGHNFALSGLLPPDMGEFKFGDRDFRMRINTRGPSLGVSAQDLTRQLADYFGVKQGKGVLVAEVVVGSAAEKAGIKAGDVIVRIDSHEVGSAEELRRALPRNLEEKRKVNVTVVRDHRELTLAVELEPTVRTPVRRAEAAPLPGFDPDSMTRMAGEYARHAAEYQAQMQELKRELELQTQRMKEEWRRYRNDYQRQLQKEIESERNRPIRENTTGVI